MEYRIIETLEELENLLTQSIVSVESTYNRKSQEELMQEMISQKEMIMIG